MVDVIHTDTNTVIIDTGIYLYGYYWVAYNWFFYVLWLSDRNIMTDEQFNRLIGSIEINTAAIKEYTASVNNLIMVMAATGADLDDPVDFDEEEKQPTTYLDGSPIK